LAAALAFRHHHHRRRADTLDNGCFVDMTSSYVSQIFQSISTSMIHVFNTIEHHGSQGACARTRRARDWNLISAPATIGV
jgi:hypothetical protein